MQTLPIVDYKTQMIESIIARSEYISLQNDDVLFAKLFKLPFNLLYVEYNKIVKGYNNLNKIQI